MEQMGQVIFVVCRESVEALLVIGILWAWMSRNAGGRSGKKWLLAGVGAGLLLALMLALALAGVTQFLGGEAQAWFEIGMLTFASALIVQMVYWMRQHGRTLKKELETGLERNVQRSNWWGVFFLAMIAVGREGSETVMFLYGSYMGLTAAADYAQFFLAASIGLALALFLFYLLQVGSKYVSWPKFFKVTEILLLFLGFSLFLTATEKLMNGPMAAWDLPSWMYANLWDSSALLSDSSVVGGLFASLFGYRSSPIGFDVVALAIYWGLVALLLVPKWRSQKTMNAPVKTKQLPSQH